VHNQLMGKPGNTKGGYTIDLLFDCFLLFLYAEQTNLNQSNRRSTVQ
jgi:hypothetical protein